MKIQDANKKWFNQIADVFDRDNKRYFKKESPKIQKAIFDLKKETSGQDFLDLGCGTGIISLIAKNFFSNVHAIDISKNMIEELKKKDKFNEIKLTCHDITRDLPYSDNSFDVVFSNALLHHLPYEALPSLFKEIKRILKPNGIYYCRKEPNQKFFRRYKILIKIFRFFKNLKKKYNIKNRFNMELLKYTELYQVLYDGLNIEEIKIKLNSFFLVILEDGKNSAYFSIICKK